MRIARLALRGCGYLPHVGSHPGSFALGVFVAGGAAAGGWIGAAVTAALFGPVYLYGAYERAVLSERLQSQEIP